MRGKKVGEQCNEDRYEYGGQGKEEEGWHTIRCRCTVMYIDTHTHTHTHSISVHQIDTVDQFHDCTSATLIPSRGLSYIPHDSNAFRVVTEMLSEVGEWRIVFIRRVTGDHLVSVVADSNWCSM